MSVVLFKAAAAGGHCLPGLTHDRVMRAAVTRRAMRSSDVRRNIRDAMYDTFKGRCVPVTALVMRMAGTVLQVCRVLCLVVSGFLPHQLGTDSCVSTAVRDE